ncbi:hypothetical protein PTI98_012919 [Pleurotus ostreatus]|nr:hypothetical protein PTI98_012919 [Pleurotus ostreatus]
MGGDECGDGDEGMDEGGKTGMGGEMAWMKGDGAAGGGAVRRRGEVEEGVSAGYTIEHLRDDLPLVRLQDAKLEALGLKDTMDAWSTRRPTRGRQEPRYPIPNTQHHNTQDVLEELDTYLSAV